MKNIIQLTVILSATLAMTACSEKEKPAIMTPTKTAANSEPYRIFTLAEGKMTSNVQLPGLLQPFEAVQIYPKMSGFVKEVLVDRGSRVKKGATLVLLEAPEVEERVSEARLKYAQARSAYLTSKDRYDRLLLTSKTPGTVSPYNLSAAQAKMEGDEATANGELANYNAQKDMLAYLTVKAPFDGVITERNIHPGALVGPGVQNAKPMLILQQQSRLRMVVSVPEQYSSQIKIGDEVYFTLNALPGQHFTGTVARRSGDLNSYRSETLEVDVPNGNGIFKTGMYAEVTLKASGNMAAFVVPKTAVVETTEKKYVILSRNGKAEWVDVTEGSHDVDRIEVFGALQKGNQILANANYSIANGQSLLSKHLAEVKDNKSRLKL